MCTFGSLNWSYTMLCAHRHAQCRRISGDASKLDPSCHYTSVLLGRNEIHNMSKNENTKGEKETKVRFIHYVHGLEYLETVMPRENVT